MTLEECIEAELEAVRAGVIGVDDVEWIECFFITHSRTQAERMFRGLTPTGSLGEYARQAAVNRWNKLWPFIRARIESRSDQIQATADEIRTLLTTLARDGDTDSVRVRAAVALARSLGMLTNVLEVQASEDTMQFIEAMREGRYGARRGAES